MNSEITLREVARSRLDLSHEDLVSDGQFQAGADAVAVAFGTQGPYEERVRAISPVVSEQLGSLADVGDDDIEIAVVVEVANRQATTRSFRGETRARHKIGRASCRERVYSGV